MKNGCAFIDKGHFGGGSQPGCMEATLPTEDDDRRYVYATKSPLHALD